MGKTHIAQALAHQACRHGYTAAFTKTSRLLADLGDC
ncbi:MAG: ATP-binding protein [Actinomycetota bacterium]